jgi:hypothetical protein
MEKITNEEYQKAHEIVRRYEQEQIPQTYCVSVTYDATVSVTVRVPAEWDIKKIKEELKNGPWYLLEKEDEERIHYDKITELIVNGDEII